MENPGANCLYKTTFSFLISAIAILWCDHLLYLILNWAGPSLKRRGLIFRSMYPQYLARVLIGAQ
jgi:hypothetical protein